MSIIVIADRRKELVHPGQRGLARRPTAARSLCAGDEPCLEGSVSLTHEPHQLNDGEAWIAAVMSSKRSPSNRLTRRPGLVRLESGP